MRIEARRIGCVIVASMVCWAASCSQTHQPSEDSRPESRALTPAEAEAEPITEPGRFPPETRPMLVVVIAELEKQGGDPAEYYASTEADESRGVVIFHLWHRDFFRPEHAGLRGNIDGKGRDMYFDIASRAVIKTVYWR